MIKHLFISILVFGYPPSINSQLCIEIKGNEGVFEADNNLNIEFILTNNGKKTILIHETSFHYEFLLFDSANNLIQPFEKVDRVFPNVTYTLRTSEKKEIKIQYPEIRSFHLQKQRTYFIKLKIRYKKTDFKTNLIKVLVPN